jgi:glycosyltransferase involved in cell wall biosynthesis
MAEAYVRHPEHCILFATADWDEPYWTNKQHCAKSLAELGTKVLYVESVGLRSPQAGSAKDWARIWNRLCKGLTSFVLGAAERAPGIFVLSPLVVPAGHRHPVLRWLNRNLLRFAIASSARRIRFECPLVWTYHPFMLDVLDALRPSAVLYHCVDDLAAIPGVDAEVFREAEVRLLQRADVVFATAPSLADNCKGYNPNTHFFPNVVDAAHFGRALEPGPIPEDLARIPEPRLCYHGVLSDFKIDFQLLLDAARMKPEWSWVFLGEEREGQKSPLLAALATLPNVHFLGYKPYAVLPDYLRGMRVGLLPSLRNTYTNSMFPMKYYEYVAAGLPILSTLQSSRLLEHDRLISVSDNVTALTSGITTALALARTNQAGAKSAVGTNTWADRTRHMLAAVFETDIHA